MHHTVPPRAVVLLSGGLDSTTVLALARDEGHDCAALTVRYGQRHEREIESAQRAARRFGARPHAVIDLDLRSVGGSSLTGDAPVPKDRPAHALADGVPSTYVPARNTIFLALALGWAESLDADAIFLGVSGVDYSGYPDCRPAFIEAFERLASLGTRRGVEGRPIRVRAPLLDLSKRETIALGLALGVDYGETTSCYDPAPDGAACGRCDACQLRLRGFAEAGVHDPARYGPGAGEVRWPTR